MEAMLQEARAALWAIWNRRWLALGVAWGVCVLGWLVVALIPNTYQSDARVFVHSIGLSFPVHIIDYSK